MALLGLAAQPSLGLESWGGTVGSSSLVEPGTLGLRQEAEVFGKGQSPSENFRTFPKIQESVPKLRNISEPCRAPPRTLSRRFDVQWKISEHFGFLESGMD